MYFVVIIFVCSIRRSKRLDSAPQALPPARASPLAPPYHGRQLSGWLWCQIIKQRPPKANSPPITLFFDGSCVGTSSKGTSSSDRELTAGSLQRTHRQPQCLHLSHGDRRQSRWRVGRWRLMLFVVCFVFCVCVLCCVCLRNYSIIFYFWDKGQISKLCAAVNKEPPQKHTDSIRYVSVE